MNVAVLYIATGRYITFFKGLYETAEKNFLKDHKKTYFVFTDNEKFDYSDRKNVVIVPQKCLGWPYDSMLRYEMFLKIEEELKKFDYCFYINANSEVKKPVGEEIFPTEEQSGLAGTVWANFYYEVPKTFPYCRNEKSQAYIPEGEGKYYFMGGFNGGRVQNFLEMCREISQMTKTDIDNNELPSHYDESLLNKYFLNKNILVLTPNYCFPAKWKIKPFCRDVKIEIVKKHHYKYGGHAYLRGETDKKITPLKYWLNKIFNLKLT